MIPREKLVQEMLRAGSDILLRISCIYCVKGLVGEDHRCLCATNEHTRNEDFNNASGDAVVYRYFWPELAAYFGLQVNNVTALETSLVDWAKDKRPVWERVVKKYGGNAEVFDWCQWGALGWADGMHWPTLPSATKARKFGWKRFDTATECWFGTFKSFQNAGILPRVTADSP